MHLGTPVIATDSPMLSDYLEHDVTGLLFEGESVAALAEAIRAVTADPTQRARLAAAARSFAAQHLSADTHAAFIRDVLRAHA